MLVSATKATGLSLGDRVRLALARQLGVKAMTADRSWSKVACAIDVRNEVIRCQESHRRDVKWPLE